MQTSSWINIISSTRIHGPLKIFTNGFSNLCPFPCGTIINATTSTFCPTKKAERWEQTSLWLDAPIQRGFTSDTLDERMVLWYLPDEGLPSAAGVWWLDCECIELWNQGILGLCQNLQGLVKEILNAFKCKLPNGPIEGFNNKIKVLKRSSYGIRNFKCFWTRILRTIR